MRPLVFLCYLTKQYSYFELLLQYLFKNAECPEIIITTVKKLSSSELYMLILFLLLLLSLKNRINSEDDWNIIIF